MKINNQQRKNLCNLIDVRAKACVENVDTSDDTILTLVSKKLRQNITYIPLQKELDVINKKHAKKKADVNAKIKKLKDELDVIENERCTVKKKIEFLGLDSSTGNALHDRKWTGRNYRDQIYKTVVYGDNEQVWKDVEFDLQYEKNNILKDAVTTKEKIWLAETREEAEQLIKE
jgi:hypothetical protein